MTIFHVLVGVSGKTYEIVGHLDENVKGVLQVPDAFLWDALSYPEHGLATGPFAANPVRANSFFIGIPECLPGNLILIRQNRTLGRFEVINAGQAKP